MTFQLTQEQEDIIAAVALGKPVKIKAFAGAAKTSTLVFASEGLGHRCLYLAYNKRMQEEAKTKFPAHVEVRTVHSVAYQSMGVRIAHKLSRPRGAYRNVCGTASEVARYFKLWDIPLKNGKKILGISLGKVVRDTVSAFENSAHDAIGEQHLRLGKVRKFILAGLITKAHIQRLVLPKARELWEARIDEHSPIMATHETYLKMFQLSKPNLGFRTVFLDEAQDSNDCVLDIVLSQKAQVVIVGDDYQSIYQWRGSINALNKVDFPEYHLTTSWRFGQQVADVARVILEQTVPSAPIKGNPAIETLLTTKSSEIPIPFTKIFRTNIELLLEAVELMATGVDVHIEVDFRDLLNALSSAEALYHNDMKAVKHDLFVGFADWNEARQEGETDGEVGRLVRLIEKGDHLMIRAELEHYEYPANPVATYITAHKSKGLEWDNVVIAHDFPSAYKEDEDGEIVWGLDEQGRNLMYVAQTRAKKRLYVGEILQEIGMFGHMPSNIGESVTALLSDYPAVLQAKRGIIADPGVDSEFVAHVAQQMVGFGQAWTYALHHEPEDMLMQSGSDLEE